MLGEKASQRTPLSFQTSNTSTNRTPIYFYLLTKKIFFPDLALQRGHSLPVLDRRLQRGHHRLRPGHENLLEAGKEPVPALCSCLVCLAECFETPSRLAKVEGNFFEPVGLDDNLKILQLRHRFLRCRYRDHFATTQKALNDAKKILRSIFSYLVGRWNCLNSERLGEFRKKNDFAPPCALFKSNSSRKKLKYYY